MQRAAMLQPNAFGLVFHHFGLAVEEVETATTFLSHLGYVIGPAVHDPEQNAQLLMCRHQTMPAVEVIYPSGRGRGPVDGLLAKHSRGIVYHLCFTAADLDASLAAMEAGGLRALCLSEPKPAVLFGGERVSFYVVAGMGLIEIIEGSGVEA